MGPKKCNSIAVVYVTPEFLSLEIYVTNVTIYIRAFFKKKVDTGFLSTYAFGFMAYHYLIWKRADV